MERPKILTALVAPAVMAVALAGCGRIGPLDPPPGNMAPPPVTQSSIPATGARATGAAQPLAYPSAVAAGATAPENSVKNGFDAQGNPIAAPGEKKSFFLDFLLN